MRVVIDIEANGLENPTEIWCVVCKDIDTGEIYTFRKVTSDADAKRCFDSFCSSVDLVIGHNWLGYDGPVLRKLLGWDTISGSVQVIDTLIISKLVDYSRPNGHSIEAYGLEFGYPKGEFTDFSHYSDAMVEYCQRDVEITEKVYRKYRRIIEDVAWQPSIRLEHDFQLIVNDLHDNGFAFNSGKAQKILDEVTASLTSLDKEIADAFPERLKLIREIHPKLTKHGTLSRTDFRWVADGDLSIYNGGPFSRCEWTAFNPSSPKQIIEILNNAGWSPINKTKTHIVTEREYNRLKRSRQADASVDLRLKELYIKMEGLKKTGWKVDEENLSTLPPSAPAPSRLLAKRILLESRRRTLTEWLSLVGLEIDLCRKSIRQLGHAINEELMQRGVPRNVNIIEKDVEKEIWRSLENLSFNSLNNTCKKSGNADTIYGIHTDSLSKILINWLKSKKVNVKFVNEKPSSVSIMITPPERSEDCSVNRAIQFLDGLKKIGLEYKIISERIRGKFFGIGAWTHRMAHQNPNTANIPNEYDTNGNKKLYGKEMRSLWVAPRNRLLIGVDAEGIQLRIFAHYINDAEFTQSLVEGKKDDKTDPHSLNQRILGSVCKSRAAAKRFIYALLLGAGNQKLSEILGATSSETQAALDRLLSRYSGWATLKDQVFPKDAARGYFVGLDGRKVPIPGDTEGTRRHLAMSGYLQSGEAVCMKLATLKFYPELQSLGGKLVNFVHDEWQSECKNNMEVAIHIAKLKADALRQVGGDLKLNCPLAGSYWNDDLKDYTIGTNWSVTH